MDKKLEIIQMALNTLELIPVTASVDCERKLGISAALRTLASTIRKEESEKKAAEKEESQKPAEKEE